MQQNKVMHQIYQETIELANNFCYIRNNFKQSLQTLLNKYYKTC